MNIATCPACGVEVLAGARFCGSCGGRLESSEPLTEPAQREEAPFSLSPAPRGRRIVAAAIDVGIALVLAMIVVVFPLWMKPFVRAGVIGKIMLFFPPLYLLFRDSIAGRSVGKAVMGLVVVDLTRRRTANLFDSVVRNWPVALLLLPIIGRSLWSVTILSSVAIACGIVMLVMLGQILAGRSQRLGDGFATTQVVDARAWGSPAV